ncbi:MAG: hypothetical protein VR72_02260 [Clostridiaceae bacterium BRH_c20a]|nr:MAG: hypothetical protein VR72_02260 [Clostridiaceae bacterium BRH_c20a]
MFIIDRFEGDWAVIEYNGKTFNIPQEILPSTAKEGDAINVSFTMDKEATKERKKKVKSLVEDMFE